ncbi:hypothetical protein TNCV_2521581 [Trichonephila clavipes]|nr:hypothetical protein TNCV_2521581 [Trichonephila clavipes]
MSLFGSEINKNRVCVETVSMLRVEDQFGRACPRFSNQEWPRESPPLCNAGPHPGTTLNYKTGGIIHQLIEQPGHAGLWSGREKKKREILMARKRAENREGSLGFPGIVKPVFTKDSKPPREKEKITRAPRERETRTHLKNASPLRG